LLRVPARSKTAEVDLRALWSSSFLERRTLTLFPLAVVVEADASGYDLTRLNFARLLHRYTRTFVLTDTEEALNYLYLVCLNADVSQDQVQLCHDYVRELVMDTRKYSMLLGDIRNDGIKIVRRF